MKPIATAVLSEDSPASAPPAAPMTTSAASHSRGLPSASCQVTQATADIASVTAIAMPCGPLPKCGVNSGTVIDHHDQHDEPRDLDRRRDVHPADRRLVPEFRTSRRRVRGGEDHVS